MISILALTPTFFHISTIASDIWRSLPMTVLFSMTISSPL